jgi:HK97 gp10 family phage protein
MDPVESNHEAVIAKLQKQFEDSLTAAGRALAKVATDYQRLAFDNASGPHVKSGPHKPWAGAGPNVRTGFLRRSIKTGSLRRKGFPSYEIDVTAGASYSRKVEEGTAHTGKYPFMRPAFVTIEKKIDSIFLTAYRRYRSV